MCTTSSDQSIRNMRATMKKRYAVNSWIMLTGAMLVAAGCSDDDDAPVCREGACAGGGSDAGGTTTTAGNRATGGDRTSGGTTSSGGATSTAGTPSTAGAT